MLTMRFVAVRDVLDPSRGLPAAEEGLGISTQGNNNPNAQWSIQVQHGRQRQRTRSIVIDTKQKPGQESSQQSGDEEATVSSIWDDQIEIEDVEREETVEISLLCEFATRNQGRTKLRHSSTSLEMRTFRGLPDQRVSLWIPLHSTAQGVDHNYGELHLSLTYCTDDCVVEGYLFGLFCGLAPPSLAPTWLTEIPFMRYANDASKNRTPSLRSSRSMPLEGGESFSSATSQAGLGFVARSLSFPAFGASRGDQVVNGRRKTGATRDTKPQGGIHVSLPMEEMDAL